MPFLPARRSVASVALALFVAVACSGRSGQNGGGTGATAGAGGTGTTRGGTGGMMTGGAGGTAGGSGGSAGEAGVAGTSAGGPATGGAGGTAGEPSSAGSSGTAGSGATDAGPPGMTDEEVCSAACDELILGIELPSAFCEDWLWTENYADAEFCLSVTGGTCAERCGERLGAVSDPCHAALLDAIPCAAATDLYSGSGELPVGCLLEECFGELTVVTSVCNGAQQALDAARALWAAEGSLDYSYEYGGGGDPPIVEVVMGVASLRSGELTEDPRTIPELFDAMQAVLDRKEILRAVYDETLGYPIEARFVRPICNMNSVYDGFFVTNVVLE